MRLIKKFLLVILFISAFTGAFSQEYDFDIPEEEDDKIDFNGNLDAKWGLLQVRKSSPFYGLQFYDAAEKEIQPVQRCNKIKIAIRKYKDER